MGEDLEDISIEKEQKNAKEQELENQIKEQQLKKQEKELKTQKKISKNSTEEKQLLKLRLVLLTHHEELILKKKLPQGPKYNKDCWCFWHLERCVYWHDNEDESWYTCGCKAVDGGCPAPCSTYLKKFMSLYDNDVERFYSCFIGYCKITYQESLISKSLLKDAVKKWQQLEMIKEQQRKLKQQQEQQQ